MSKKYADCNTRVQGFRFPKFWNSDMLIENSGNLRRNSACFIADNEHRFLWPGHSADVAGPGTLSTVQFEPSPSQFAQGLGERPRSIREFKNGQMKDRTHRRANHFRIIKLDTI